MWRRTVSPGLPEASPKSGSPWEGRTTVGRNTGPSTYRSRLAEDARAHGHEGRAATCLARVRNPLLHRDDDKGRGAGSTRVHRVLRAGATGRQLMRSVDSPWLVLIRVR